jgi:hypothetical protein
VWELDFVHGVDLVGRCGYGGEDLLEVSECAECGWGLLLIGGWEGGRDGSACI